MATGKPTHPEILARIEADELELREKWVKVKLRLTDWLATSAHNLTPNGDVKNIKCVIDAICGLEKLIGPGRDAPKHPQDLVSDTDRAKSLVNRLNVMESNKAKKRKHE